MVNLNYKNTVSVMTTDFKDHFSNNSEAYRIFRPDYPVGLFHWLAHISPQMNSALDCGCGTGQAAVALAQHFEKVYAVDPSSAQIKNAIHHEKVIYLNAPAEMTGLPQESQDLIIAAQSLHWFDLDRYYSEVRRLARRDAIFAAITYGLITVNHDVDAIVGHLYHDILGNYWPPERHHVDEGYKALQFPFSEIPSPIFAMTASWRLEHLAGYLATWSAVKELIAQTGRNPLESIHAELQDAWGDLGNMKRVSWPLVVRAGRIN